MDTELPPFERPRGEEPVGRLGKYALIKALAKGGMAQVFLAQRDGAEEICVLKQLLGEVAEHETAVKRFHREAKLASYLNHRNIARVLDAGFEGSIFYIAMEYVLGKDLEAMSHDMLRKGRLLPYPVSLASVAGALEGLSYAHAATAPDGKPLQLVHRDLSPRNVMLSVEGLPKVIDFGVARSDSGDFRTAPGMLVGTLRYVSPEQAVAEEVDARSDLYSLSVVLHELLTGQYSVPAGDPMKVLKYVVTETLPPVHALNPDLPPALSEVIAKGLEKEKSARWPDAASFRQALLDAAGPLAEASEANLGTFVRSFFESDVAIGEAAISFGKQRYDREFVSTSEENAKALSEKTRTGYVPSIQLNPEEPPHLGTVVPVELTSPGALMPSVAGGAVGNNPPTNLVVRDRSNSALTRTTLLPDAELRAMFAPAGVSNSGATPVYHTDTGIIVRHPPRKAPVLPVVLIALASALAGGFVVEFLRRPAPPVRRAPEPETLPRPMVTRPAPILPAEPAPPPVEQIEEPELVAPPRTKTRRTTRPAPPKPEAAVPLGAPPTPPPTASAPPTKTNDKVWAAVDRDLDGLMTELGAAQKEDQTAIRVKLRKRFTEAYAKLPGNTRRILEQRLTSLLMGGNEAAYRKLANDMKASRSQGGVP